MLPQLAAFLRKMKTEESKANKRKRNRKKAGAKTNNDVSRNNKTANSARPMTPAEAATRPATAATPSTKSPFRKRGKTTKAAPSILPTVSRDDNTPTNRSSHNNTASKKDISRILYDEKGKLSKKVIAMLQNDEDYALIPRKTTRDVQVSAAAKVIAPYFDGNVTEWTNTDSSKTPVFS